MIGLAALSGVALMLYAPDTIAPIAPNPLASDLAAVLAEDPRNRGVDMEVRYAGLFDRDRLVFNMRGVSGEVSRADVFRVFLQVAQRLRSKTFAVVELRFRGEPRFVLDGAYFRQLGEEYQTQNAVYTIRKFPSHLKLPSGAPAYGGWTGGLLGVVKEEIEDFNDFHDKWYLSSFKR